MWGSFVIGPRASIQDRGLCTNVGIICYRPKSIHIRQGPLYKCGDHLLSAQEHPYKTGASVQMWGSFVIGPRASIQDRGLCTNVGIICYRPKSIHIRQGPLYKCGDHLLSAQEHPYKTGASVEMIIARGRLTCWNGNYTSYSSGC